MLRFQVRARRILATMQSFGRRESRSLSRASPFAINNTRTTRAASVMIPKAQRGAIITQPLVIHYDLRWWCSARLPKSQLLNFSRISCRDRPSVQRPTVVAVVIYVIADATNAKTLLQKCTSGQGQSRGRSQILFSSFPFARVFSGDKPANDR